MTASGINLAYCELFVALAAVLRRFDIGLWDTEERDVRMDRDGMVPAPREGSRGVRVVVKGEWA
jgi:cytochrome P450